MSREERGRSARRAGKLAEEAAVWLLRLKGYAILERGYAAGRGSGAGEVDIIARRGRGLVFAEVKSRPSRGEAAHAIQPRQRARIERGAEAWLQAHPSLAGLDIRFDALFVSPLRPPQHLEDAWRPDML
jgi:putative endonuclease